MGLLREDEQGLVFNREGQIRETAVMFVQRDIPWGARGGTERAR